MTEVLVVVGAVGLLAAVVLSSLAWVRASAKAGDCRSRLRQLAAGVTLYAEDYSGWLPAGDGWRGGILQQINIRPPFQCPAAHHTWNPRAPLAQLDMLPGYAYNQQLEFALARKRGFVQVPRSLVEFQFPSTTVVFCDAAVGTLSLSWPAIRASLDENAGRRHLGGANYAFLDGHVKWYRPEQVEGFDPRRRNQDGSKPSFRP